MPTEADLGKVVGSSDEFHVTAFERLIGARLPEDYRAYVLRRGGGVVFRPEPVYPIGSDMNNAPMLDVLLSFDDDENCGIVATYRDLHGRLPPDLVPIAADPGGDYFLLGVAGERRGRVFYWSHERENLTGADLEVAVEPVTDSFTTFVDGLVPWPE